MKYLLPTTVAAVVLVGCGESQQSTPAPEAKPEPPTTKAPDISIHKAAERGNIEAVKQHLDAGADVNAKDKEDLTTLMWAVYYDNKEIDNKNYTVFILITFILVSFIIGERSNFIKFFISSLVFFLIFYEINLKKKIIGVLITVSIFSILFFTISNDNIYKTRFINQMPNLLEKNGIKKFMLNSTYGSHYNTALSVFKNNIIFGVGIKNYRNESVKKIYTDQNKNFKFQIMGTHPHQIHLEFLSETGIFGYLSFFKICLNRALKKIK